MLKVYTRCRSYARFITCDYELVNRVEDCNLLILPGGADVSPSLYGDEPSRTTYCSYDVDEEDIDDLNYAKENNIPVFGICRGIQFLHVMAGGKLIQDTSNHAGWNHMVYINKDGIDIEVNSYHHQMVNCKTLGDDKMKILAVSTDNISERYIGSGDENIEGVECEVEAAYYPELNAVGVQWHPEGMSHDSDSVKYCNKLLNDLLNGSL